MAVCVRRSRSSGAIRVGYWSTVTLAEADILDLAREVLTPLQLRVWELKEQHGCSWNQIAYMTDRAQPTVRGHYRAAVRRIHRELERRGGGTLA